MLFWTLFSSKNLEKMYQGFLKNIKALSRESKGYPNSRFDRGVVLRGRGRYPLKPSIFASLLETKGYPEHTAARSSRESHKCNIFSLNNLFKNYDCLVLCSTQSCTYIFTTMFLIETFLKIYIFPR